MVVSPSCISPARGRRIPANGCNRPYQGESFVAPVTFSVGTLSAYPAVVHGARYDLLLGLLFAVLSALAIGRGSEYHRAYST